MMKKSCGMFELESMHIDNIARKPDLAYSLLINTCNARIKGSC